MVMCSDIESQKQNFLPIRKTKRIKSFKLVPVMLNVRLLMLTRPFNTSLQRGADVTVGTSYVSAEFKDSVVRCVTNQILSCRPSSDRAFLSTMLVLSDVLAFLKPNFNSYPY